MSTLFLRYKTDGPDSKWIEVGFNVDTIQIQREDTTIFEITPTTGRLGAFTIKEVTRAKGGSVNFIAKSENIEVQFLGNEGVDVY